MKERYVIIVEVMGAVLFAASLVYSLGIVASTGIFGGLAIITAAQSVSKR